MLSYDLAIIGAGWAGFNAALRARDLGLKVALIDKSDLGGTCLNKGCIPTKALIQSAKTLSLIKKANNFGVHPEHIQIKFSEVQARKNKLILQLRQGMNSLLKGIDYFNSEAILLDKNTVDLKGDKVNSKYILIATGSRPYELPVLPFDAKIVISSDDILDIGEMPGSILIIGAGVIGCEFASLFSILGSKVKMIEKLPRILANEDLDVSKKAELIFKKKGIEINTNTDSENFNIRGFDLVLVSVGRIPNTKSLGLANLGIMTEKEKIITDDYLKTNIPNIYAAGDCTGKIMLAHFASYQGKVAAENIFKDCSCKADNTVIPNCIFTEPEIASVGLSEEIAKAKGLDIKIDKFDFMASGMARILEESEGFIKVISDKSSEKIIGASIIGPRATELIALFTLAVSCGLKRKDIKDTVFAHPTLSESIGELF
jgi:dihydrolipoamide dehydrogenase